MGRDARGLLRARPGADAASGCPTPRLLAAGIDEAQLPLWIPESDLDNAGFMRIDGTRAVAPPACATGRSRRRRATRYAALRPEDGPGLDPALEARLIAALTIRSTSP